MKCSRCQQENSSHARFCLECGAPVDGATPSAKSYADLHGENEGLRRSLGEAHAQVGEALARESATSAILRAIGSSPTYAQPVFETIARSALSVCAALGCVVFVVDGDMLRVAATAGVRPERVERFRRDYPISLSAEIDTAQTVRRRRIVHLADIANNPNATASDVEYAGLAGYRTRLMVPVVRGDRALGLIAVTREDPTPFPTQLVELLRTFADQAAIAIENVRLFKELRASNRDLTTALDKQTATSEILRVINRSQTDVQPVFDAILASAVRLLGAYSGSLTRRAGDQIDLAALTSTDPAGDAAVKARYPQPLQSDDPQAQTLRDRAPLNFADAQTDPRLPEATHAYARARGWRSAVMVPMLRHGEALGTISVTRRDPGGFTDDEIALLKTFADQAVIAIENVRLFKELQEKNRALTEAHGQVIESLERQTATADILRVISSSPTDAQPVFDAIVRSAVRLCNARFANVFRLENDVVHLVAHHNVPFAALEHFRRTFPQPLSQGGTLTAQAMRQGTVVHIHDVEAQSGVAAPVRALTRSAGYRTVLAVPILGPGNVVGAIGVGRSAVTGAPWPFSDKEIALLQTFADQAVIAIENVRLFNELEAANRGLKAVSQHKSEFLANMSHELRTPLNAIIGFSEILTERMFGELNDKQDEYLRDIYASGQHLLSLINDILDLSKIEAGRMELELADFHLPQAIESALVLVRERALRRGIALEQAIDERLGDVRGDERKVKQVLLNLLSNAIKFTPDGGRINVQAVPRDAIVEVSVSDTGVGIAPEDQEAIFEEFRQVGTAAKKVEGTGLGLTLSRKFIELHGGRIWVESQLGTGSTFTFTIPLHCGE